MKTDLKSPVSKMWKQTQRRTGALLSAAIILCSTSDVVIAQNFKKPGKVKDFHQSLNAEFSNSKVSRKAKSSFKLYAGNNDSLTTTLHSHKLESDHESFLGQVEGDEKSLVYLTFKDGKLSGKAIIPSEKKSYVYSTNASGEVEVQEEDINKAICIDYSEAVKTGTANAAVAGTVPGPTSPVYNLQSLPGAAVVLMLDFDGEYVNNPAWNGGQPINALPNNFTENEIIAIWKLVSEDMRAFNINVVTNNAAYSAAALHRRIKCIFSSSTEISPGAGGVAYINSFYWNDETPCWVFNGGIKGGGEAASHELGHTLGLNHDGRTSPVEEYYYGNGNWAPIMGVGYGADPVQWSKGEYQNASNLQDDLSIITSTPFADDASRNIGFRPDEAGNTTATAKLLAYNTSGNINTSNVGILAQRTDIDIYYFNSTGGTANILVKNLSPYPNLDIKLTILNNAGAVMSSVVNTIDQATSMDASFKAVLSAGKYFIVLEGVGKADPLTDGYSDYSSFGQYQISGNIIANTPPTISLGHSSRTYPYTSSPYYAAPATIEITALVNDLEGPIKKVEFYQNNILFGIDSMYPGFSYITNNLPAGNYTYTAKVFDQSGLSTISTPVSFAVDATAPAVSITNPVNNAQYVAPANINLSTSVSDPESPISKVEFYQGNVLVGTDMYYPSFDYAVYNLVAGTYTFTAKAFNKAGLSTVSSPVTVIVNCAINQPVPPSAQFVLRNVWSDQNSGSTIINEAGALKVIQRAYGQNELWVLQTQQLISVTNGNTYNIKFDYKDFAAYGVVGIDAGFATGINGSNNGPVLTGSTVTFPAGYSSANFTTKSVNLTSTYTGSVFLAIRLRWANQPTVQVVDYLKNLVVCAGAGTQMREEEELTTIEAAAELAHMTVSPNPSETEFNTITNKVMASLQVTNLQGKRVFTVENVEKSTNLSFGQSFEKGFYMVNVLYADGTHDTFKILKSK